MPHVYNNLCHLVSISQIICQVQLKTRPLTRHVYEINFKLFLKKSVQPELIIYLVFYLVFKYKYHCSPDHLKPGETCDDVACIIYI